MTPSLRRAVWLLGLGQCVYWGVLYYAFSVLLVPMVDELHASRAWIAGAFSLGLLVMALVAPQVGRWVDRDRAPRVMLVGAAIGVGCVVAASQITELVGLYLVWAVTGLAMAALFYEPALGLVIRTVKIEADRLRALASVTVVAGLSSTIFLPLMAFTVKRLGWRHTELAVAAVLVAATGLLHCFVLPAFRVEPASHAAPTKSAPVVHVRHPAMFAVLAVVFVLSMIGTISLTTLLIPVMIDRGQPSTTAALVLAAFGVMQLPGRIWLLRGGRAGSIPRLLGMQLALQITGLVLVSLDARIGVTALGVACFGGGAGIHTLARPWALQSIYGVASAGRVNGVMARYEGFARAGAPVSIALLYDRFGALRVFGALAAALLLSAPILWKMLAREARTSTSPA